MYQYNAVIYQVIDGDTFRLDVDLGFNIHFNITGRLLDVDTPEKFVQHKKGIDNKNLGLICKAYAKQYFEGKNVVVKTQKPDSFGRTLCHIYINNKSIVDIYNELGFNLLSESFSESKIIKYKYLLGQD